jgi:acyl-CoA thioesterase-1
MKPRTSRLKILGWLAMLAGMSNFAAGSAFAATIVALGASNTYGKGVARNQAFPAQLETILRAKGLNVRVLNAALTATRRKGCCDGWIAPYPAEPMR